MEQIPQFVREALLRLEAAGYEAWCVGGAVRDLLLGREPGDWDVTTSALPEQVMALFAPHALPTGLKHGTVTVGGGRGVEVTTYRRDGDYSDNRHPDQVSFTASLEEDLSRRDFTINAIAMDARGSLFDAWDGQEDLAAHRLRAVGEPERRFREDALRILRALRFASRLGFSIEEETARALHQYRGLLESIAPERVCTEMTGILCGEHVLPVLLEYPDVLGVCLPEILPCVGFDQHSRYHCYDVWEHTARSVSFVQPQPILRWTMLLHDLGKPETFTLDEENQGHFCGHFRASVRIAGDIMGRLRFDHRSRAVILTLVERHDSELSMGERAVRRQLARYGEETLRLLLAVKRADNLAQHPDYAGRQVLLRQWETMLDMVLAAGDCFSLKQLAVGGADLMDLGLRGPAVGCALQALLEQVIDEKLPNERAALLAYVKENRQ